TVHRRCRHHEARAQGPRRLPQRCGAPGLRARTVLRRAWETGARDPGPGRPPTMFDTSRRTNRSSRLPDPVPTTDDLIADLSTGQRARLGSGRDFWSTEAVGAIPSLALTDGPHGLRYQDPAHNGDALGIGPSIPATCFPPAGGLSQSWDPELAPRVGAAIGREAQAAGVHIVLGPGINIKRDPRCGRNFEYYSEDPHLTAALATGWVRGLQGQGIGASLKHFAANNAEFDRMRSSSDIDPRPLREI